MPIFYSDEQGKRREATTIAEMRKACEVPDGMCLGCYIGDDGADMHDVPDDCKYLSGFLYELGF